MKILQISPVAPPQRSGMANAAGEIFKATKKAVELGLTEGVNVELVAAFGDSTIKNLHHYRVPGAGFLAFTPKIISLYKRCDIVHLHYPCYGNALMVSFARAFGGKKPLVISYHMDTVGRGLRRPVFWLHQKFLAPHFLRQADKIVVASRDYAEHSLLAKYPELMSKVVEIPFGIDTKRFCPSSSPQLRQSYAGQAHPLPAGGEGEVFTSSPARGRVGRGSVLFVAALDEQHYFKGLNFLLEAMVQVPEARLTVVGDGGLKESYIQKAKELKIADRVIFAGRVSDEELPKYFQSANVFCSASVDRSEAFGMVLMEAAASGLPSVATDIAGVRTVVKNNETGLLVKSRDPASLAQALNSILDDAALADRLGKAAREFALTRSWAEVGRKYLGVYESVV
jgi:glycosyltransferase involved in cell wall biosynthesis